MSKENISHEFRLRNIDEIRTYFLEEIKQNELVSRKHKKAYTTLSHFSVYNYWIYFSFCFCFFAWLLPIGITSFAIGLKFAHGLLTRSKLNSMEVLIEVLISWNSLIDSNISDSLAI